MLLRFLFCLTVFVCLTSTIFAFSAGSVDNGHVKVHVALQKQNVHKLERIVQQVSSPTSPQYGQYLSLQQIRDIVAPPQHVLATLVDYFRHTLHAHDVQVIETGDYITMTLPTQHAQHLQQYIDQLHSKTHQSKSKHAAVLNHKLPQVISELHHVQFIIYSSNHMQMKQHQLKQAHKAKMNTLRQFNQQLRNNASKPHSLKDGSTVGQRQAYGVPDNLVGTNPLNLQQVWGTGTYGVSLEDLSNYYSQYNIDAAEVNEVLVQGDAGTVNGPNWMEATLDATVISGMALNVTTQVLNTDNSTATEQGVAFGDAMLSWLVGLSNSHVVPYVISMSLGSLSWDSCNILCNYVQSSSNGTYTYADCQAYMENQFQVCMYRSGDLINHMDLEFIKLSARGVTLLAAAGDGGSHYSFQPFPSDNIGNLLNQISCQLNFPTFPAESAHVVAVGGSDWPNGPTAPVAWSAGGSGFSWRFPMPAYQQSVVLNYLQQQKMNLPPSNAYAGQNRAYPDVAALANNVPIVENGQLQETGGTSASTPSFAGIISLINDQRLNQGLPTLGLVNPRLYQIAAAHPGEAFYDITQGNSACNSGGSCCNTGFPAATGWDAVSGLGTPLFPGLIKYLGNDKMLKQYRHRK